MAGKSDVVPVRFFIIRFCTDLVAARVVTAARRPKNSTRTVIASVFEFDRQLRLELQLFKVTEVIGHLIEVQ